MSEDRKKRLKLEAKLLVNKIYQPTGYLSPRKSLDWTWEWSKKIAIDMIEHFISKMPEGSDNWLYHRELIDEINKT